MRRSAGVVWHGHLRCTAPERAYAKFRFLIRGHVLAHGTLTGLFGRKG
ncbi:MAG TPA: hypothetical protein VLT82_12700 [Myxococcaceae bacterium]|nr:hypothetical protein [Myxococcaceae bacterium]